MIARALAMVLASAAVIGLVAQDRVPAQMFEVATVKIRRLRRSARWGRQNRGARDRHDRVR